MEQYSDEDIIKELTERIGKMSQYKSDQKNILKELEVVNKKLKESEALKTNFLSNIRNEIINPFTSILTLSKSIMSVDVKNADKIKTMVSLIHLESFELDFQFKNIFAAAAIEAGEFYPEYSRVNVFSLVSDVIALFLSKADQKQITIKLEVPENFSEQYFVTDSEKLQLIISNLLSNAIKYSHVGSDIKVIAENIHGNLMLSIQDWGIGFDKISEEEIFNRFTQLDSGLTRAYGGHGLGLSITRSTVECMNGEIKMFSKKNNGCRVKVFLKEGSGNNETMDESDSGNEIFFNNSERF
jgi:signal transduction histidine kinase